MFIGYFTKGVTVTHIVNTTNSDYSNDPGGATTTQEESQYCPSTCKVLEFNCVLLAILHPKLMFFFTSTDHIIFTGVSHCTQSNVDIWLRAEIP